MEHAQHGHHPLPDPLPFEMLAQIARPKRLQHLTRVLQLRHIDK